MSKVIKAGKQVDVGLYLAELQVYKTYYVGRLQTVKYQDERDYYRKCIEVVDFEIESVGKTGIIGKISNI